MRRQLDKQVDLVLDGGPCRVGVESTIVSLADTQPVLLRAGGLPVEEIERVIGAVLRPCSAPDRSVAPGQLSQHYAPRTPLILQAGTSEPPSHMRTGLLSFRSPVKMEGFASVEVLSPSGDLREAAANLFAALHRLDALGLDLIVADSVPDAGLGLAINDRLCRASAGTRHAEKAP